MALLRCPSNSKPGIAGRAHRNISEKRSMRRANLSTSIHHGWLGAVGAAGWSAPAPVGIAVLVAAGAALVVTFGCGGLLPGGDTVLAPGAELLLAGAAFIA